MKLFGLEWNDSRNFSAVSKRTLVPGRWRRDTAVRTGGHKHYTTVPIYHAALRHLACAEPWVPCTAGTGFHLHCLQFDVSENSYWFKTNKKRQYHFLRESSFQPDANLPASLAFYSAVALVELVSLLPCHDLLEAATQRAHLDEFEKRQLLSQLQENSDICTATLGCTNVLKLKILTYDVPIKQKPYPVSPSKLQSITEHNEDILEKDLIKPFTLPYAAPVVLVLEKHNPQPRFCIHHRKINAATHTDAYPIPNFQEILESLAGAAVFTTLNLNSSYWQVENKTRTAEKRVPSSVPWAYINLR